MTRTSIETFYKARFFKWKLEHEKNIRRKANDTSRAILKGQIGEQILPLLPEFKYLPSDARFIGNPIDYIIFNGYTNAKDEKSDKTIEKLFIEVKTGKRSELTPIQKK